MSGEEGIGWARPARRVGPNLPWRWLPANTETLVPAAHHLTLILPWATLVMSAHATGLTRLPLCDWELVALRASFNSGGWSEWQNHVFFARLLRRGDAYLTGIVEGPGAPCWDERAAAVLSAVDELHDGSAISDTTRARLGRHLTDRQCDELRMVTGIYELIAMVFSTFAPPGELINFEPRTVRALTARHGARRPRPDKPLAPAAEPSPPRPKTLSVQPDTPPANAAERAWLPRDPTVLTALARNHRRLARLLVSAAKRGVRLRLSEADIELVVQRTVWRCGPVGEWRARAAVDPEVARVVGQGPDASGLEPRRAALMRAVDELDTEFFIGDVTWAALTAEFGYDVPRLLELCLLVGHYRAFAMLLAP
ncbi:hypothetical protein [Nocardia sp. CDC160]|uniref:hypothetical protein n=1 Tax=Nocardia sp. CDC160 TaxID=3112166 RepID=UPI002DB61247|nr:hypothetical protein [Nocardia sp. CDC160]MEC3919368.1 hypothetical protein [Nocardia sp. CDC160]